MEFTLMCKGTPEEIAAVVQFVQTEMTTSTSSLKATGQAASTQSTKTVSPDLMRKALTRRPLTRLTQKMLCALYDAKRDDRYVSRRELLKALGFDPGKDGDAKLRGVLGKFGMRMKHTPGYDGSSSYFKYQKVDGEWYYRLPDELREIVRQVLGIDDNDASRVQGTESSNDFSDES